MFDKEISKFSQSDVYSVVCELLYTLKGDKGYAALSELAYILDSKSFTRLVKYFGGTTVKVPSVDEFKQAIKVMQLYHHFNVENMPWKEALTAAGYTSSETRNAQRQLMAFTDTLSKVKIGRDYE